MSFLNIDVSNKSIASYKLSGDHKNVEIIFEGIPDIWENKTIYATFIQDDINITKTVLDYKVEIPKIILESDVDFYVGLYIVAYGSSDIEKSTNPILVCMHSPESQGLNMQALAKAILKINVLSQSLSKLTFSGDYNDLKNTPEIDQIYNAESSKAQSGIAVAQAIAASIGVLPEILDTVKKLSGELNDNDSALERLLSEISNKVDENILKQVAFTGEYNDLNNKPLTDLGNADSELLDDITDYGIYRFSNTQESCILLVDNYAGREIYVTRQILLPDCKIRLHTTEEESANNPRYWTQWESMFPSINHSHSYKELRDKPNIPYVEQNFNSSSTNAMSGVAMHRELLKKVAKEDGKQLSSNDFTNEEKRKLSAIDSVEKINVSALEINEEFYNKFVENGIYRLTNMYGFDGAEEILLVRHYSDGSTQWYNQIRIDMMSCYMAKRDGYVDYVEDEASNTIIWGKWHRFLTTEDVTGEFQPESSNPISGIVVAQAINAFKKELSPTPLKQLPEDGVLIPNISYNLGDAADILLRFPNTADDGDVIYVTFMSGAEPTSITIDITNTSDIDIIPESHTGYEIYAKYNGSIWIVGYSEYMVTEAV